MAGLSVAHRALIYRSHVSRSRNPCRPSLISSNGPRSLCRPSRRRFAPPCSAPSGRRVTALNLTLTGSSSPGRRPSRTPSTHQLAGARLEPLTSVCSAPAEPSLRRFLGASALPASVGRVYRVSAAEVEAGGRECEPVDPGGRGRRRPSTVEGQTEILRWGSPVCRRRRPNCSMDFRPSARRRRSADPATPVVPA